MAVLSTGLLVRQNWHKDGPLDRGSRKDKASGWGQHFDFLLVVSHCWLHGSKWIRTKKTCHLSERLSSGTSHEEQMLTQSHKGCWNQGGEAEHTWMSTPLQTHKGHNSLPSPLAPIPASATDPLQSEFLASPLEDDGDGAESNSSLLLDLWLILVVGVSCGNRTSASAHTVLGTMGVLSKLKKDCVVIRRRLVV